VIEEEEKTLMMIVGQEGRGPKWWDRAWASKLDRDCSRCREGRGGEGAEGGMREQGRERERSEGWTAMGREGRVPLGMLEMRREGRDRRV
jgi:hypothetical protein